MRAKGFTLVELLVVIAIIAILSVIGVTVFSGVQKNARDAQRKANIDAIAKSLEVNRNTSGVYPTPAPDIPKDPRGVDYFWAVDNSGTGFKVCTALDANSSTVCNTQATNCYCMSSQQGTIPATASLDSSYPGMGLGSSTPAPACDVNGTLMSGLVGYWKMDDNVSGNNQPLIDSSGKSITGITKNGLDCTVTGKFNFGCNFDGTDDFIELPVSDIIGNNNVTVSAWVKPFRLSTPGTGAPSASAIIKATSNYNSYEVFQYLNGKPIFGIRAYPAPSPGSSSSNNGNLSIIDWSLVTFVVNRQTGQVKIYVNVSDYTTTDISTVVGPINSYFNVIGRHGSTFPGIIDDVRIYNRALSSDEVKVLYNNGSGCVQ